MFRVDAVVASAASSASVAVPMSEPSRSKRGGGGVRLDKAGGLDDDEVSFSGGASFGSPLEGGGVMAWECFGCTDVCLL